MNIGDKLKKYRINNSMKQSEVADILYLSEKTISSWENNRTVPDLNMLYRLSNLYKVSFLYLIDDSLINDSNDEVCIRLKVDQELFEEMLKKFKNEKTKSYHQIDKYYIPIKNENNEWLRLRNENGKCILNYKKKINAFHFTKNNVQIDNNDSMNNIFINLGFKVKGIVEKERIILNKEDFIINFDKLKNVGYFIEIKLMENTDENKIFKLLNELNISTDMIDMKKYIDYC